LGLDGNEIQGISLIIGQPYLDPCPANIDSQEKGCLGLLYGNESLLCHNRASLKVKKPKEICDKPPQRLP
jgi:hypothetical protein